MSDWSFCYGTAGDHLLEVLSLPPRSGIAAMGSNLTHGAVEPRRALSAVNLCAEAAAFRAARPPLPHERCRAGRQRKAVTMVSEEQLRTLAGIVLEASSYQFYHGANDNPALGQAIRYVDQMLLPWAEAQADGDFDVENIVAEAGLEMLRRFPNFRGTTGREFYGCMKVIVVRGIARMRRLMEAKENGCLRRAVSLERSAEAARLAERLASGEPLPEVAAIVHENAQRLHRAMRGLTVDQLRVIRLHGIDGRSLREISAQFGHAPSWAHEVWKAAAAEIRRRLMRTLLSARRRPREG
jgi:RNA polymerase sigma factor (sigma-70 family)